MPLGIVNWLLYHTAMKPFLVRWFVTTLAVAVAAGVVPGIHYGSLFSLLGVALLLGIVNALMRPVLLLLSLPLILVTMGLFVLVINALMLWFVSSLVPDFKIDSFWSAFFGAILVSIVSWVLSAFFRGSDGKVYVLTHHSQIKEANARVVR